MSNKKYKGVFALNNRFFASISHQNVRYHLGTFDDPVEAAKAYDAKAKELKGPWAKTNFLEDEPSLIYPPKELADDRIEQKLDQIIESLNRLIEVWK